MNRALVTGGSGYFGEALVRKLAERGSHVRNFDLNPAATSDLRVETVLGDIRDAQAIVGACQGIDTVFHNVAQVPLAKDSKLFWSVNVDGTRRLLESCLTAGVKKVVVTSSSAVFGAPKSNPISETTLPMPGEDYGRAKLEGERLCAEFSAKGLDVTIIRPRTIVGSGRLGIFQILFDWIRQGRKIPVLGDGSNRYQFVHSDDLAEACVLASERPGSTIYNCGAERFGTMRETIEAVCRYAATGSRVIGFPMAPAVALMKVTSAVGLSPLGPYHSLMYGRSMYFDISKAQRELGWKPRFSNEEMMIESYRWYLEHRSDVHNDQTVRSHHRSPLRQGVLGLVRRFL